MSEQRTVQIPGGEGGTLRVAAGDRVAIVNVEGSQVCDFVAIESGKPGDVLSPTHTRSILRRTRLHVGDALVSRNRAPMFELVEDAVGCHDMTLAMCDAEHYRQVFGRVGHRNCRDNIRVALAGAGVELPEIPDPFNWFQNSPIDEEGSWIMNPSPAVAGDRVVLRALVDCVVAASACPQDLNPINGGAPSPISLSLLDNAVS